MSFIDCTDQAERIWGFSLSPTFLHDITIQQLKWVGYKLIFWKYGSIVEIHKICISYGLSKLAPLSTQNNGLKQEKKNVPSPLLLCITIPDSITLSYQGSLATQKRERKDQSQKQPSMRTLSNENHCQTKTANNFSLALPGWTGLYNDLVKLINRAHFIQSKMEVIKSHSISDHFGVAEICALTHCRKERQSSTVGSVTEICPLNPLGFSFNCAIESRLYRVSVHSLLYSWQLFPPSSNDDLLRRCCRSKPLITNFTFSGHCRLPKDQKQLECTHRNLLVFHTGRCLFL